MAMVLLGPLYHLEVERFEATRDTYPDSACSGIRACHHGVQRTSDYGRTQTANVNS